MNRSTFIRVAGLTGLSLAWALPAAAEPACPSLHTPGTPMVCDLINSHAERFDADGTLSKRITLPLNTTIDDNELPTYSLFIDVDHTVPCRSTCAPR
ncbi:hypothetical protein L2Y96_06285 [Luteibacter aegosomaticola]|uniref:hypothetical protein n=1 Tax=Luteibacter aegosomaticola TaxID=2911538 RepID=UPI001FFAB3E4|nr:hypothetical protein [Luteibacter aegosomaticola]UPG91378.1 hypothetical protein L2Y96_06285 [Luteibacter aegosomaticola]